MKLLIFILAVIQVILTGCMNGSNKQGEEEFDEKINKLVLSENKAGEEYFFKVPSQKGILEYKVKYLGSIKTSKGNRLKFLNNVVFTGLYEDSRRANCTLNIYDDNNKRIGYYYVGGVLDAPQKVEGSNLVFDYNNDRCNQSTAINFKDSIPHQIFVSCTKEGGDLYTFSNE